METFRSLRSALKTDHHIPMGDTRPVPGTDDPHPEEPVDREPTNEALISELNKSTLANYTGKAAKDAVRLAKLSKFSEIDGEPEAAEKFSRRASNHVKGITRASNQLAKEETVILTEVEPKKSFKQMRADTGPGGSKDDDSKDNIKGGGMTATGEKANKIDTSPKLTLGKKPGQGTSQNPYGQGRW